MFLLANCGDNKAANNETQIVNSSTNDKKEATSNTSAPAGEGLVGTWKLQKEVFDMITAIVFLMKLK